MAMPCAPLRQAVSRSPGFIPPSANTGIAAPRTRRAKPSSQRFGMRVRRRRLHRTEYGKIDADLRRTREFRGIVQEAAHQPSTGLCCRRASCAAARCTPSAPRRRASSMSS